MLFQLKQVILKEFKTHALKSIFWRTYIVVFQHSAYNVIHIFSVANTDSFWKSLEFNIRRNLQKLPHVPQAFSFKDSVFLGSNVN